METKNKFKVKDMVFINDLKIYGTIDKFWIVNNNNNQIFNYIIKDQLGVFHERFEEEITKVNNIQESIREAKCNVPLEMLIDLFNQLDKRYTLTMEVSKKKENDHSSDYVQYAFVRYGGIVYNKKENKYEDCSCFIKNGNFFLPNDVEYTANKDEYECCLSGYDSNLKEILFELYMEIITRIK